MTEPDGPTAADRARPVGGAVRLRLAAALLALAAGVAALIVTILLVRTVLT
jgi:hypothetical protein